MSEVKKVSEITFKVSLDENNIPIKIDWNATDNEKESNCKAVLISLWDEQEQNTMRIDLWNKDMQIDEMKKFFHQSLVTMADTFERATGEDKIVGDMRDFCDHFAEKMKILTPNSDN
ncbi:MAG: gliding motility-associated protein GldC [Flavobacteriales bacterium]|jgi:gliding motility-associated protein GldC